MNCSILIRGCIAVWAVGIGAYSIAEAFINTKSNSGGAFANASRSNWAPSGFSSNDFFETPSIRELISGSLRRGAKPVSNLNSWLHGWQPTNWSTIAFHRQTMLGADASVPDGAFIVLPAWAVPTQNQTFVAGVTSRPVNGGQQNEYLIATLPEEIGTEWIPDPQFAWLALVPPLGYWLVTRRPQSPMRKLRRALHRAELYPQILELYKDRS